MSSSFRHVLEKMDNSDPDYRYMASSDLLQQLQGSALQVNSDIQKRLCRAVLKLLNDSNSEVQGMAMKCVGPLAAFVSVAHTEYIVDKLLDYVLASGESKFRVGGPENVSVKAMRDVASLGLKSILADTSAKNIKITSITKRMIPRLTQTLRALSPGGDGADILIETLELLHDALARAGGDLVDSHTDVSEAIFCQLPSSSPLISKRAILCIGVLAANCDNSLFVAIVKKTIADLEAQRSHETIQAGVQTLWALSKTSGHRISAHVYTLGPILFKFITSEEYSEDNDLREHCLQTLASLCSRCKREMSEFGKSLVNSVISLAKYDPNYAGNESEEEESEEGTGSDDVYAGEFGDEDDYSDDDDSSWKVRRAAIRCLHSAISVEILPRRELCEMIGPFLVTRFKEREEAVRLDVFGAFSELLLLCSDQQSGVILPKDSVSIEENMKNPMVMDGEGECRDELMPLVSCAPQIMRNIKAELGSRSLKTRTKATLVVRDLVIAMPSAVTSHIATIIKDIENGLLDSATAMKTESLVLLRSIILRGGAEALRDSIEPLIRRVLTAADDRYYKVTAECFRFCGEALVGFGTTHGQCAASMSPLVPSIYDASLDRVTAQDQDSEVKDAALHCLGASVSFFGSSLGPQRLESISAVLSDRLGNEVTRIATIRALHSIAQSEAAKVLLPVMNHVSSVVSGFLRKNNSSLRAAALEFLYAAPVLPIDGDAALLANVSELIADSDLRLACMALQLATRLIQMRESVVISEIAREGSVYPKALALTASPLLQGRTARALIDLFRSLSKVNALPLDISYMMETLASTVRTVSSNLATSPARSAPLHCIAKCIVAVRDSSDEQQRTIISEQIITHLDSNDVMDRVFSLICLGEIGRSSEISKSDAEKARLREPILLALNAPQDEVRTAAALALGGITSADGASGVPHLMTLIQEKPEQRYLLLLSLKEAISSSSHLDLLPVVPVLVPFLLQKPVTSESNQSHTSTSEGPAQGKLVSEEESVRTATAECLGLLVHVAPEEVLSSLKNGATSEHTDVRVAVAAAIKFGASSTAPDSSAFSSSLRSNVHVFVELVGDMDVNVAKNALQALNALAKSRPSLLVPHMDVVVERVAARLNKDGDLVRIVDLGPFKHEEDYGLDMRKSSFDCIRTFVSGPLCLHLRLADLVEKTLVGLADDPDVRAIAQLIITSAAACPLASELCSIVEPIVKALEMSFNEKIKQNAVRQETERHDDSIRGAVRAVKMLETVPEVSGNRFFQSFLTSVVRTGKYLEMYDAIGQSDVELLTLAGMKAAENGDVKTVGDIVMSDR